MKNSKKTKKLTPSIYDYCTFVFTFSVFRVILLKIPVIPFKNFTCPYSLHVVIWRYFSKCVCFSLLFKGKGPL